MCLHEERFIIQCICHTVDEQLNYGDWHIQGLRSGALLMIPLQSVADDANP